MASLSPIPRPKAGDDVRGLWRFVDAVIVVLNALISNVIVVQGNAPTGSLSLSEGNALLTLPQATATGSGGVGGSGSGSGSGASKLYCFAGTASGQVAYFLLASDGTAYPAPPAGYTVINAP